MFYKFKENGELENSSNVNIDGTFQEIEFTEEEIQKLNDKYIFIDGSLIKGESAEQYEIEKKETRKQEIIIELGQLKIKRDGIDLIGEDTSEIDSQIQILKTEYSTIIS